MLSTSVRKNPHFILALFVVVFSSRVGFAQSTPPKPDFASPLKFSADLLAKGFQRLPKLPAIEINLLSEAQLGLLNVKDMGPLFAITIGSGESAADSKRKDLHHQQLLEVYRHRNELMKEHNLLLKQNLDYQVKLLNYQLSKDASLLRKEKYSFGEEVGKAPDPLIVVVADFSSGNMPEGAEVADEIAIQLGELKKLGLNLHVLVGEIKPGVVIRNEEMARDLGKHFPEFTNYVVIWGSMSPRTTGRYRPHITSVQTTADQRGISSTFTIDLDSTDLPVFQTDPPRYQRECYERMVGATCAAIPSLVIAHELSHDRVPDLKRLYEFLGDQSPEVRKLKEEVNLLTQWARSRGKLTYLRRISSISARFAYPQVVHNERDNSLMVLIADDKGQPITFKNKKTQMAEVVYIDVAETTNEQYVAFLNANMTRAKKKDGGVYWLDFNGTNSEIAEPDPESSTKYTVKHTWGNSRKEGYGNRCPVVHVSWHGAEAYCEWAGKSLPTRDEWQAAAEPKGHGRYPWGDTEFSKDSPQCSSHNASKFYCPANTDYPKDRSRIRCFDMAGNVAEWTADEADPSDFWVCGSDYRNTDDKFLTVKGSHRKYARAGHFDHVGFRGVTRIPVVTNP